MANTFDLSTFPDELVLETAMNMDHKTQGSFRLACKRSCRIVTHHIFANVKLTEKTALSFLHAIASHPETAAITRTLRLDIDNSSRPSGEELEFSREARKLLRQFAIGASLSEILVALPFDQPVTVKTALILMHLVNLNRLEIHVIHASPLLKHALSSVLTNGDHLQSLRFLQYSERWLSENRGNGSSPPVSSLPTTLKTVEGVLESKYRCR
jgi:hypothetical protein